VFTSDVPAMFVDGGKVNSFRVLIGTLSPLCKNNFVLIIFVLKQAF
jgi:hypothetical protein